MTSWTQAHQLKVAARQIDWKKSGPKENSMKTACCTAVVEILQVFRFATGFQGKWRDSDSTECKSVWLSDWVTESYLFAFLQQQLQSVVGSFGHHFIPLRFILTLGVVHVDAEVECYIHQGCHQLHGCQKHKHHWEIQSNPPTAIATGLLYNKQLRKVTCCEKKKSNN